MKLLNDLTYGVIVIRTLLVCLWTVIAVTVSMVHEGVWSIQGLLTNKSYTNASFQITESEYECMVGLPYWISLLPLTLGGLFLDRFGMSLTSFIIAIVGLCGAFLRSTATQLVSEHVIMVIFLVLGECINASCVFIFISIRNYMASTFFGPNFRSTVAGFLHGASRLGAILIFLALPRFGLMFGTAPAFWLLSGFMLFIVILSFLLLLMFRESEVLKAKTDDSERLSLRESIRSFNLSYWFLLLTMANIRACYIAVVSNSMAIQRIFAKSPLLHASSNILIAILVEMGTAACSGFIASLTGLNTVFILIGVAFFVTAIIFLLVPVGSVLLAYIFVGISHGATVSCLIPIIIDYVPESSLGLATSLIYMAGNSMSGILELLTGVILQNMNSEKNTALSWRTALTLHMISCSVALISSIILVVLKVMDKGKKGKMENETEKLVGRRQESKLYGSELTTFD